VGGSSLRVGKRQLDVACHESTLPDDAFLDMVFEPASDADIAAAPQDMLRDPICDADDADTQELEMELAERRRTREARRRHDEMNDAERRKQAEAQSRRDRAAYAASQLQPHLPHPEGHAPTITTSSSAPSSTAAAPPPLSSSSPSLSAAASAAEVTSAVWTRATQGFLKFAKAFDIGEEEEDTAPAAGGAGGGGGADSKDAKRAQTATRVQAVAAPAAEKKPALAPKASSAESSSSAADDLARELAELEAIEAELGIHGQAAATQDGERRPSIDLDDILDDEDL
jgi:hypothetical protein